MKFEKMNTKFTRIILKIWYIGTNFSGSQRQVNKRTVEGELIRSLYQSKYIHDVESNNFKTAARTDAKVHAREAVYCFNTEKKFYLQRLESFLPYDVGISAWGNVPLDFHPRWEAKSKIYRYIYQKLPNSSLNFSLMKSAMKLIEGHHNFKLFSKTNPSKSEQNTELTMKNANIIEEKDFFLFEFESRAFLWQQIRRMVSFIIKIGNSEKSLEDLIYRFSNDALEDPFEKRDKPCNPEGLILWKMDFGSKVSFTENIKGKKRRTQTLNEYISKLLQESSILKVLNE